MSKWYSAARITPSADQKCLIILHGSQIVRAAVFTSPSDSWSSYFLVGHERVDTDEVELWQPVERDNEKVY